MTDESRLQVVPDRGEASGTGAATDGSAAAPGSPRHVTEEDLEDAREDSRHAWADLKLATWNGQLPHDHRHRAKVLNRWAVLAGEVAMRWRQEAFVADSLADRED